MIRRTVDQHEPPFEIIIALKNVCADEKGSLPPKANLKALIPKTKEHPPRVPHGWEPTPSKLAPVLKSAELRRRELHLNSLLEPDNIDSL
jgi:hypothetical protein